MGACICPTPSLVKVFLVDTIIELLLKWSEDIIKFVAGPLPDVYLKALLFFRGFLTMITQKHGRKLASQLGEVLFVCQFYDLQIETKVSLSLRNFVVALSVCVCPSSPQRHYILKRYKKVIRAFKKEGSMTRPFKNFMHSIYVFLY